MACLLCPKPCCLELRFVTPDDTNVADLALRDTSEKEARDISVGPVEVTLLDFRDRPIEPESGKAYAFNPGEKSLLIHGLLPVPKSVTFRYVQEDDATADAAVWGPVKRAAVQIGNEELAAAPNAADPHHHKNSTARQNAKQNGWGFVSASYRHLTPPISLNTAKILRERKEMGREYKYPTIEENMLSRFARQQIRINGAVDLIRAERAQCPECRGLLLRLVIELRGMSSLKPLLHVVENWRAHIPYDCPELYPGYDNTFAIKTHPFYQDAHIHNALNLGALAALAYADFELSEAKTESGSIYDFFRDLSLGEEPREANGAAVNLKLKRCPYGEGYPLPKVNFFYNTKQDAQGFGASDKEDLLIVFRGTLEKKDFVTDGKFVLTDYADVVPAPGKVHLGFKRSVEVLHKQVMDYCNAENAAGKRIFVCGHSLGGAMATIMSLILTKTYGKRVTLYTYGSPRVGDANFVRVLLGHNVVHYRFVDHNDGIARIPRYTPLQEAWLMPTKPGRILRDLLPNTYLHHGNFCHLMQYFSYEWACVLLSQNDIQDPATGVLATRDTAVESRWNFWTHGTDHSMKEYLSNMNKAVGNITNVQNAERYEEYNAQADIARSQYSAGRWHFP